MADTSAGPKTALLAPPQLRALVDEIARFRYTTRERGQHYAASGRVGALSVHDDCVRATVRGSDLYETLWQWDGDTWEPDCTCPVAPYCKHAYAVACCLVAGSAVHTTPNDPRLQRLLPSRLHSSLPVRDSGKTTQPRMPAAAPAPARTTGMATLMRLRSARDMWSRQQHFTQLVGRFGPTALQPYDPPFAEILRESDPDLLCFRLAQEIPRHAEGWLPPALQLYRDRPDLAARATLQARTALAHELVQWATQQRKTAQRSLRLVLGLAAGNWRVGVTIEARVTTPRMPDAPRTITQLQQLRNELRRAPGFLPPEHAALLEWLTDYNVGGSDAFYASDRARCLTGTALKSLLARVSDSPLVSWAADISPDLATRGGIKPGEAVRLGSDPVRLLPTCVSRDHTVCVDFMLLWPDGRQRRLEEVLYLRGIDEWSARAHPSFVVADGVFSLVVEEPPQSLLERFHDAGGLPLPPAERGAIIGLLAASFPHLVDTLAAHTRFHPVQPMVALDLREDDWLQIRLFAHAASETWRPGQPVPDHAIIFEYTPHAQWMRHSSSAPMDEAGALTFESIAPAEDHGAPIGEASTASESLATDVWVEAPNPQCVEPAVQWLTATQAEPGFKNRPGGRAPAPEDRTVGWWMQMKAKKMHAFADLWEHRPAAVTFFGTERVRRLLSGEQRATPILHIESSGLDWFSISAEWEAEGMQLSDADLAMLRAATTRFVRLSSGWVRRDVSALHDETAQVLADLGVEAGEGTQRVSVWQLVGAKPESLRALERFGADPATVRIAQRLRERVAQFTGLPHVPPPCGLKAELRPYQQRGLDFLAYTSSLDIGAVLADDMGLGKTVQALAWLTRLREHDPDGGPSLVVCPASVVHNWAREAERFAPGLRVLLLTSGKTRHQLRRDIPAHDLIVTNYALLRRDLEAWRAIELRIAILDEAQNIKNPDAAVTRAALALRARHRLALTGTPLENRALDLWSIVSFVNPGYLGNRAQFQNRFDRLDAPPHARTLLAAKLRPVLLRRTKREVATDLPERIEERRDCELTKEQRHLYLAELRRSRALVEHLSAAPGGITQNKIHILAALTRLRQICCHPALAGGKVDLGSGKFDALFELLEPLLAEGHKVLLFSQFVECLKLLKAEMRERGIAQHTLTGQTVRREQVVDAFQNDPRACVFLISLKAGGTGLNLTAASYVVLFDPWWNPAVEAQAIDRTHRIGQDRTVIAYRMLMLGTIEEKIWELQQRKAALARDILGEGGFARALTRDDLNYLLADS